MLSSFLPLYFRSGTGKEGVEDVEESDEEGVFTEAVWEENLPILWYQQGQEDLHSGVDRVLGGGQRRERGHHHQTLRPWSPAQPPPAAGSKPSQDLAQGRLNPLNPLSGGGGVEDTWWYSCRKLWQLAFLLLLPNIIQPNYHCFVLSVCIIFIFISILNSMWLMYIILWINMYYDNNVE